MYQCPHCTYQSDKYGPLGESACEAYKRTDHQAKHCLDCGREMVLKTTYSLTRCDDCWLRLIGAGEPILGRLAS